MRKILAIQLTLCAIIMGAGLWNHSVEAVVWAVVAAIVAGGIYSCGKVFCAVDDPSHHQLAAVKSSVEKDGSLENIEWLMANNYPGCEKTEALEAKGLMQPGEALATILFLGEERRRLLKKEEATCFAKLIPERYR